MELRLLRFTKVDSPLMAYAKNVTSQCGEDGIIERIIELIQPAHRFCVEFGAWDGTLNSNCHQLLMHREWKGVMIEANEKKYRDLVNTFSGNGRVKTINRFVDFEGPNTLDNILIECGAPPDFGLLSIDIDGNDYHVWKSLERHSPEIVIIEFNPTIPNDVYFIQDRSFERNQGCSLLALVFLAKERGYELAVCTTVNAIFVKKEKFGLLQIQDNSHYTLYQPLQDGRIFSGYDGTIHVVGMDKLFWQGIALSQEDFQLLPKAARVYRYAEKK
jgi:hypothetical protein